MGGLPRQDPVRGVPRVEDGGPIRRLDHERRHPEVAGARPRQREADRLADPVVVAGERQARDADSRGRARAARRVEVADPAVLEDGRTQLVDPLWRCHCGRAGSQSIGHAGRHSPSSTQVQRCSPVGTRYAASVSGPQLAVPTPRWTASMVTYGLGAGARARRRGSPRRGPRRSRGALTPGAAGRGRCGAVRPGVSASSQRTAAWPPFSCGRTYGTSCSATVDDQRADAAAARPVRVRLVRPRPEPRQRLVARPAASSTVPTRGRSGSSGGTSTRP